MSTCRKCNFKQWVGVRLQGSVSTEELESSLKVCIAASLHKALLTLSPLRSKERLFETVASLKGYSKDLKVFLANLIWMETMFNSSASYDTKIAIASCCDEPDWACEIL